MALRAGARRTGSALPVRSDASARRGGRPGGAESRHALMRFARRELQTHGRVGGLRQLALLALLRLLAVAQVSSALHPRSVHPLCVWRARALAGSRDGA